jgi:alcohol dehydrogenase class IV
MTAYEEPQNIEAREKMAIASNLAGIAFSNGGLGAAHALAHPVGIHYKIPHGIVNAVLITAVMRFNLSARKKKFLNIARALLKDKEPKQPEEAIERLEYLKQKLNLNRTLRDFGIEKKDFSALAEGVKYSASIKFNPIPCGKEELIKILEMAF